jgi:hypothetical protein
MEKTIPVQMQHCFLEQFNLKREKLKKFKSSENIVLLYKESVWKWLDLCSSV